MTTMKQTSTSTNTNTNTIDVNDEYIMQVVEKLAEKYKFDKKTAFEYLESTNKPSAVTKESKAAAKQKEKQDKLAAIAEKKAEKEAAKAEKAAKPKKPPSAYLLFCKEERPLVVEFLTKKLENDEKLSQTVVMSELGSRWHNLSEIDKATWNEKALAMKEGGAINEDKE
jgi:hypothetical protein